MYVQQPVDFDSINYLPGFPSLSIYGCAPDSWNPNTGGCAASPVSVGRESAPVNDSTAMALAIVQAANKVPVRLGANGSWSSGAARRRSSTGLGANGSWSSGAARRRSSTGLGCACGGSCGGACNVGLGQTWTDILGWLESNWMPLLIGGGVVWFLKKRR